ncbi:hypothetical protein O0L34_g14854 [Tuta absoluta]|nr:hypothetical protein O0L34_g14854 [Tuta absoluta]
MTTICKYCNTPEDKQENPGLICENCISFIHLSCLRRPGTPGDFACDVFFDFTCADCSPDKKEVFTRNRFPWVNVLLLTLHHLGQHSYGISNHGFFHYKTHICSFIDRHWTLLFGPHFKQKKNWIGTIAGALSVYNHLFFRSGSVALGESGWWKLLHNFSPAVASLIIQENARDKPKGRPRNQMALDKTLFRAKVCELGYLDLLNTQPDLPIPGVEPATKKRRLDSDEASAVSSTSYYDIIESDRHEVCEESNIFDESLVYSAQDSLYEVDNVFRGFEFAPASYVPPAQVTQSDSSSINSLQHAPLFYDSDARSVSPLTTEQIDEKPDKSKIKLADEKPIVRRENLFSTELNSVDLPWIHNTPEPDKNLVKISEYEEIQLLKQVENLIPKVKDPNKKAYLYRLKAKLSLRRLKRHKHLPIFDIDKSVKLLGGYVPEDPKVKMNAERVLDRFQRSYLIDNLSGTIASTVHGTWLVSHIEPTTFRSAYSGTTLKPYIRRDQHSNPTWLQLMDELMRKTHKHVKNYQPPPRASIDFSYVRPQHIAAVNNLCAQFFWPGVDLTEALEYPEFSCVVTYKKLVIGCAFLVPDRSLHLCVNVCCILVSVTEALEYPEFSCVVTYKKLVIGCRSLHLCVNVCCILVSVTEALEYPEFSCVVTYKKLVIGCRSLHLCVNVCCILVSVTEALEYPEFSCVVTYKKLVIGCRSLHLCVNVCCILVSVTEALEYPEFSCLVTYKKLVIGCRSLHLCVNVCCILVSVTEALEYPEFSCVVTYKKLVIGCAFLVPDRSLHLCVNVCCILVSVTEALEYPEFSCVVTYKKLVIGCAFLVPDRSLHLCVNVCCILVSVTEALEYPEFSCVVTYKKLVIGCRSLHLCVKVCCILVSVTEALEYPEFSCVVTYKKLVIGCRSLHLCVNVCCILVSVTEALEYPEFSCVVTYKKLVIGCRSLHLCVNVCCILVSVTEALEYPEFSCVVTYKKLVIGCAFLVPDRSLHLCVKVCCILVSVTEALEYPEFSCVVTYKKLVIGCAFLVPDVRAHEAYISFLLVRPEWRRAKIATFMLYHLLQTCTGKDVTLHVSPANPAIFLYQKFGFKVEELAQDFYEKYFDIEYKGCRHALFLRLIR